MESKEIRNPSRGELITNFVKSNPDYYIKEFQKIGSKPTTHFHLIYLHSYLDQFGLECVMFGIGH